MSTASRGGGIDGSIDPRLLERMPRHILLPTVQQLFDVVTDFKNWLIENLDSFTAPAGVGKEHYSWALKNIHFLLLRLSVTPSWEWVRW